MATQRVGSYEILRVLARGGMATVYLADQSPPSTARWRSSGWTSKEADPAFAQRFVEEAHVVARLDHFPNIVTVLDFCEADGQAFIAMEYVSGGSLRPHVGRLRLPQVLGVLDDMLSALAHAAAHGVTHRDLKPENVLLTPRRPVEIADFGIARRRGDRREPAHRHGNGARDAGVHGARAVRRRSAAGPRAAISTRSASWPTRCSRVACQYPSDGPPSRCSMAIPTSRSRHCTTPPAAPAGAGRVGRAPARQGPRGRDPRPVEAVRRAARGDRRRSPRAVLAARSCARRRCERRGAAERRLRADCAAGGGADRDPGDRWPRRRAGDGWVGRCGGGRRRRRRGPRRRARGRRPGGRSQSPGHPAPRRQRRSRSPAAETERAWSGCPPGRRRRPPRMAAGQCCCSASPARAR